MAYDPGAIDATLAAAVGDEPQLIAELREAFLDGVRRGLDTLQSAEGDDEWRRAAARLKGLAASFGAIALMDIASEATEARAPDEGLLRRLRQAAKCL